MTDNKIIGTTANDTIKGTVNADIMIGSTGNDTYFVNHKDDQVIEQSVAVTFANTNQQGEQVDQYSSKTALSQDGNTLVFSTTAKNYGIVGKDIYFSQVYAKNLTTGEIKLVSSDSNGNMYNDAGFSIGLVYPHSVSANGNLVAFVSKSSNLTNNPNGHNHVYIKNLTTGKLTLISKNEQGEHANAHSQAVKISADGKKVVFLSNANNLVDNDSNNSQDLFIKDLATGKIERVNTNTDGIQGNASVSQFALSADGSKVVFSSKASNLVAGDTNGVEDIFVKDLTTGKITRVSTNANGEQANGESYRLDITPDGTKVVFESEASNLTKNGNSTSSIYLKDLTTGEVAQVSSDKMSVTPTISADGSRIAFSSMVRGENGYEWNVYVKDMATGETTLVSRTLEGNASSAYSGGAVISASGKQVFFTSDDSKLVSNDTNNTTEIFKAELNSNDQDTVISSINFTLPKNVENLTLAGNAITAKGNDLANYIYGNEKNNVLEGKKGNDYLNGQGGNDTYIFSKGDGRDVYLDERGNNSIVFTDVKSTDDWKLVGGKKGSISFEYGDGDAINMVYFASQANARPATFKFSDGVVYTADELLQKAGKIVFTDTEAGGNYIIGSKYNDTLKGLDGNDILIGQKGNDRLEGGEGDDTYQFSKGDGYDVYVDHSGNNVIKFTDVKSTEIHLSEFTNGNLFLEYGKNSGITIPKFFNNEVTGYRPTRFEFSDGVVLSASDMMSLGKTVYGDEQNQTLNGTQKSDVLLGYGGDDHLFGLNGSDALDGGKGNDTMAGGTGTDAYVFDIGDGHDTVIDDEGFILLRKVKSTDIKTSFDNNDLILSYGNNDTITIKGFRLSTQPPTYKPFTFVLEDGQFSAEQIAPNLAPVLTSAYDDIATTEAVNFSQKIDLSKFNDPEGTALTFTITQADGSALPTWLTYDKATATLSGTAPIGADDVTIKVTATDAAGLSSSDEFVITTNANQAPELVKTIANTSTIELTQFDYQVDLTSFKDPEGGTVTYTATLADGSALPSWLSFDAATGKFTGIAPLNGPYLDIKLTATDAAGISSSQNFYVKTVENKAPQIISPIKDVSALENQSVTIDLTNRYTDPEATNLTYSISTNQNASLPSWLTFDTDTLTLTGNMPSAYTNMQVNVTVTDAAGLSTTDTFTIEGKETAITKTASVFGGTVEGKSGDDVLTGSWFADTLTGNQGNDKIDGNFGRDTINGGLGNDDLYGGKGWGKDTFVFDTQLGANNVDTIHDFGHLNIADVIQLDSDIFTKLSAGKLSSNNFAKNATGEAQDADDFIVYNSSTGELKYDADGNGSGSAVTFAKVLLDDKAYDLNFDNIVVI